MSGLKDKRVLVTAGGQGIGRAIAEAFLAEGARVAVCDLQSDGLESLSAAYDGVIAEQADVSSETDIDRLFNRIQENWGGLDVLVNNAGIAGPTGPIESMELDAWRACTAVNLDGNFLSCRRAVPMMKAAGAGAIINISSTAGIYAYPLRSPYAAAKWAVVGLTETLAMELGPFGIRTNVICPGSISNPRMDGVITREAAARGLSEEEVRAAYTRQTALDRFIAPEEIADMAVFLASDRARGVNGQTIAVDGFTQSLLID